MRRIAILDAPSNLGLRPPTATSVPGCAKAPGALRDQGLVTRLQARDAGCLTPPRYDPGDWRPGDGVCQAAEIAAYSRRLADRIAAIINAGEFPVVLGGDCSVVLGSGLAMNRLGDDIGGRIGLVFVDGHSDFRHPGNASYVGAAAGEDLALVTGRGQPDLASIEGRRPYFRDVDVVVMGIRAQDEYRLDLQAAGIITRPVPTLRVEGAARSAQWARDQLVDCAGYWVHVDMDVLDPAVMPAVDAPDPGGIAFPELEILLAGLVDTPHCLGVEITVFDPDYDPDGSYAAEITSALVAGLAPVRTVEARPDLVAARLDMARRDGAAAEVAGAGATRAGAAGAGAAEVGDDSLLDEREALRRRRMAGASGSVAPAAAAMSDGGAMRGAPAEAAVPATTLMGVEDGSGVSAGTGAAADEPGAVGAVEVFPAGLVPGETAGAETVPVQVVAAEAAPVEIVPAETAPAYTVQARTVPAETAHIAPAHTAQIVAAGTLPAEVVAAKTVPDDIVPDDIVPDDIVPAEIVPAEIVPAEIVPAEAVPADAVPAEVVFVASAEFVPADPADDVAPGLAENSSVGQVHPGPADATGTADAEADRFAEVARGGPVEAAVDDDEPVRNRPLGQAPMLDSAPVPATMPGMLRPRPAEADSFSLPTQRPAFDVGPGEPADVT